MHVLIVNRHLEDTAGGSENQCNEIAQELHALGHRVTYAACHAARSRYDVPYRVIPLKSPLHRNLGRLLADLGPDVVYWRFNRHSLLRSVLVARGARIPFVFAVSHINDMKTFVAKPSSGAGVGILRQWARRARYLLDAADGAANSLGRRFVSGFVFQHAGQLPTRLSLPHAVIHNSYPRLDVEPAPHDRPYVLWIAGIKQSKNPEYFVRLAGDLAASGAEFRMVGAIQDAAYAGMFEPQALPANLRYLGPRPPAEINSLIRGALFVAHTCSEEGFPNVFLQAWLQKRPVVSLFFDPGGLLAEHGIGLYSGNYAAYRRDVGQLIEDAERRSAMGERAFRFAVAYCNREANVKKLVEFLAQVAA